MFKVLKERRLFGDAFWALFGQFGSAIALLAGTRLLTELITPETYGQVALLNGFVALGVSVFSYPFICAGMRMLPECRNGLERAELYGAVSSRTSRSTMLAITCLVIGGAIYCYFTNSDIGLFILAGILLAVTVQRELGIQLFIGERRQRDASFWQTSDGILRPLLAISLVWWLGGKAEWVLLGYILASIASNTVWSIIRRLKTDENSKSPSALPRDFNSDVWIYALPLIPMEMLFWINGLGDRYVIGYLMTAADVGLYAATYIIVNEAFNRSAMVLLRTFQPIYFQSISKNRMKEAFTLLWIWIGGAVALGLSGISLLLTTKDWVVSWLFAQSYHSAVELMPAIAIGCALHALGNVLAQPLLAHKRTRSLLIGRIFGTLAATISIPLMVKSYGLLGAAMANPIYFGIEALVLALLAKPWKMMTEEAQTEEEETSGCEVTA